MSVTTTMRHDRHFSCAKLAFAASCRFPIVSMSLVVAYINVVCVMARADLPLNQLTPVEQRTGWQLLFDGKTTDRWRNYRKDDVSDGWTVEDGLLIRSSTNAGDLITVRQFRYFELQLEYRISPGGNSGVMFHVTENEDQPALSGPEVQIQDNVGGNDPQKSGWLYQLYQPVKPDWAIRFEQQVGITSPDVVDATRPAGQWNHIYLRIAANQCEVILNGVSYYYFRLGDEDWKRRVAASKFARFPNFGKSGKGHICLQDHGNVVSFRNIRIRELSADGSVPEPVDGRLPLTGQVAFPNLRWDGWEPIDERGLATGLRPMVLTHAGDGSERIFVAMQGGAIHVLDGRRDVQRSTRFLDLTEQVQDWRKDDEEGLLGLAFHPNYQDNGYFFVYYSSRAEPRTSIVSRFRVSDLDPKRADPDSEHVVMKIPQPFANHNGGSIVFGRDGFLYIGLGDGGGRNDQLLHGQNPDTWLGSLLRIDVDRRENGRNYGIPPDNPFVGRSGALPEIYAYGFRNIWRLSVDHATGRIWAPDVGQDLWEEINIIQPGGNYGWSAREAILPFGNIDADDPDSLIEPVWAYDHRTGKSITGGLVYRGTRLPELAGLYVYGDYITGKIWALKYDESAGRVTRNLAIIDGGITVISFGEDEAGEIYYMIPSSTGKGIYRIDRIRE